MTGEEATTRIGEPAGPRWPDAGRQGLLIGEAAALLGMSVKAIRVYHERGVLPEPDRDESGYRRYGPHDLVALARISRLRAVGLSLREIAPLLRARDRGEALRAKLRDLDARLAARIAEYEQRRVLLAQLLEEGVDDPIAVSAADVWEERSIALLRAAVPGLTPEEELVERRFVRALALLGAPGPEAASFEELAAALPRFADAFAAQHRRFHELADADPDDPRVAALAGEVEATMRGLAEGIAAPDTGEAPADGGAAMAGMAAALGVLTPAQRRVMELALGAMLEEPA